MRSHSRRHLLASTNFPGKLPSFKCELACLTEIRIAGLGMNNPPPPRDSIDDADMLPEATAGWFSLVTFQWITPLLSLGYARPLEAPDLYKLQDDRAAAYIADRILASFDARRAKADEYNVRLANGDVKAGWRVIWWTVKGNRAKLEKQWREKGGKQKASLALAMNDSVKWWVSTGPSCCYMQ